MDETKVAVVTAGGSGMGADAARKLARDGYRVAILSSSGRGERIAHELGGIGITGSNRSVEDLASLVDAAVHAWGRIDAVVNSAGHGAKGGVLEIDDAAWHDALEVYLLNVVRTARLVTPVMRGNGGGAIVNVSTFAAFEPDAAFPTSSVFRAGLAAFTKLYADQHAADGIRMNNVLPGFVETIPDAEELRRRIPLRRFARLTEISETIAFLLSDGAGYITGQNLRVDGGMTRSV